jgi:deoxyribodipyrimidine photo-lyase
VSAVVVLCTRDLRVHDNPALVAASADADRVVPLFVFDEAIFGERPLASPNRIAFLLDTVADLTSSARDLGGALCKRRGDVVEEVCRIVAEVDGAYVRRWVPELADVPGGAVHRPWELEDDVRGGLDYPDPIVDHVDAVVRFRAARGLD